MKKLLLFLGLIFSNTSYANYSITPLVHSIDLESRSRVRTFTVENGSTKDVLVESELFERFQESEEKDSMRKIKTKEERKLFRIYPKIFKLKPKQKKSIVVKWIGDSSIKEGKIYTIGVAQKDLKDDPNKVGAVIRFMVNYNLNIYVNPKKVSKKIEIDSYEYVEKSKSFKITFKNEGNVPSSTTKVALYLEKKEGEETKKKNSFSKEELVGFTGKFIFPGKKKVVFLRAPEGFQDKNVSIKIFE